MGIGMLCISGFAEAEPSIQCPLDGKVKDGQCFCRTKPLYDNTKPDKYNSGRLMPYMQKFKAEIRKCVNQDINKTFANFDAESIELEFLEFSANNSSRIEIKQYFKNNIHISMDITVDIDMAGKLEVFATVNEETNILGNYAGSCIEELFSNVTFCPASQDEGATWQKAYSLEMVYHYQQNLLINKKYDKPEHYEVITGTSNLTLKHSCSCCGSVYSIPVGKPCKACTCKPPEPPEDTPEPEVQLVEP